MTVINFSADYLISLMAEAKNSPRQRQHRNLHKSYEDPCQRLLNAISVDSYIRPHRHSFDPKSETLIAVWGQFALITFDDAAKIQEVIKFGSEKYHEASSLGVGVELPAGIWHTVIALVPESILLELKAGPFNPNAAKEPAPWAPEEQTSDGLAYFAMLKERVVSASITG